MVLTRLTVGGLRDAPRLDELERVTALPAPPAGVAAADALDLWSASLDPARVEPTLIRLGVLAPGQAVEVLEEDGLPIQARWPSGVGARALLEPGARRFAIEARFDLDPVLYGLLRELAVRDPRIVTALGEGGPKLEVKVGWLLTADLTTAAVSVLSLRVGDLAFSTGQERPLWMPRLLGRLASRVARLCWREPVEEVSRRVLEASLSDDPVRRARARRVGDALAAEPFSLGRLELVQEEGHVIPCFGAQLVRCRQLGPGAARALRLAEAVCLGSPDLLVVEEPVSDAVRAWLGDQVDGEGASLEQVLLVGA